jgi:vacuolar iron transporter family protein
MSQPSHEKLLDEHTHEAIKRRISDSPTGMYLRDFVYGAIDGCITTFAIISGVIGAALSTKVIIILGFVNLLADGFSMAVSNYLGTKADRELVEKARKIEEHHINVIPDGEKQEIREIFRQKGFEGELLEKIVDTVSDNKELWIDTMIQDEWGLSLSGSSPLKAAWVTFFAFCFAGLIPLLPFLFSSSSDLTSFYYSIGLTAVVFFGIGTLKSLFSVEHWLKSGLESLMIGGLAASVAYGVGVLLKGIGS